MKKKIIITPLCILLIAIGIHYLPALPVSAPSVPSIEQLDSFINDSEAKYTDIVENSEKIIVWAAQKNTQTEYSVVYLHGFSATRQESAPLSELVAEKIGANVFYTRLNGHGRGNEAMIDNTLRAWKKDVLEAYAIGKTIGKQVIIISASTGGTLSTWLAAQEETDAIVAQLMISPNFDIPKQDAYLLDLPLGIGVLIARLTAGENNTWTPKNALQEKYWNTNYPVKAVRPMIQLLKEVKKIDKQNIKVPTLMVYSPKDSVILPSAIKSVFKEYGTTTKQLTPFDATEDTHILASDIVAPNSVQPVLNILLDFLEKKLIVTRPDKPVAESSLLPDN